MYNMNNFKMNLGNKLKQRKSVKCEFPEPNQEKLLIDYLEKQQQGEGETVVTEEVKIEDLVLSLTHQIVNIYLKFEKDVKTLVMKIENAEKAPTTAACAIEGFAKKIDTTKVNYKEVLNNMHILRKIYRDKLLGEFTSIEDKLEIIEKIYKVLSTKILMEPSSDTCITLLDTNKYRMKVLRFLKKMDINDILGKSVEDFDIYSFLDAATIYSTRTAKLTSPSEDLEISGESDQTGLDVTQLWEEIEICESESEPSLLSSSTVPTEDRKSKEEAYYLKDVLGKPLTMALTEIMIRQPRDPIQYLAHWLMKYRYNRACSGIISEKEVDVLDLQRIAVKKAKELQLLENEARAAVYAAIDRAADIGSENLRQRLVNRLELEANDETQRALLRELERIQQQQFYLE